MTRARTCMANFAVISGYFLCIQSYGKDACFELKWPISGMIARLEKMNPQEYGIKYKEHRIFTKRFIDKACKNDLRLDDIAFTKELESFVKSMWGSSFQRKHRCNKLNDIYCEILKGTCYSK